MSMTEYEIYSLWMSGVGVLLIVPGLFFAGYQIRQNTLVQRANQIWNMKVSAQQAIAAAHEVELKMQLERELLYISNSKRIGISVFLEKIEKNPELTAGINHLLNVYERYARGITQQIYDEEIIKNARGVAMIKMFDVFVEYIEYRREQDHPALYDEFENIVKKWRSEPRYLALKR